MIHPPSSTTSTSDKDGALRTRPLASRANFATTTETRYGYQSVRCFSFFLFCSTLLGCCTNLFNPKPGAEVGGVKAASREQLKVPVVEGRWRTVRGNTFRSRLKSFTVNPRFYSVMVLRCSRRLWDHRPPTLWNVFFFVFFFTCLILFCPSNILKRNLAIKDCFKEGKKKSSLHSC